MEAQNRHTFTRQVTDYVRNSLRQGGLKPGSPVTEQMLADALGVSRAPIREAFQVLTNEGIICSYPYRGRVIREMTPAEIIDNSYIVGVVEGALTTRALPHLTAAEFERLEALVDGMERIACANGSIDALEQLGNEFHLLLCGDRHMGGFALQARTMCKNISRLLYYRYWREVFSLTERARRHRALLDAVRTGDVFYIDAVSRRHQMEVGEGICRLLAAERAEQASGISAVPAPAPAVDEGGVA